MALTNEALAKLIKSFRALLSRLEREGFGNGLSGGHGGGTNVSIDLANTDLILERLEALLTSIDADTGILAAEQTVGSKVATLQEQIDTQNILVGIDTLLTAIDGDTSRIIANAATEAKQDDMESSLNTIVLENAANWVTQLAAMVVQAAANVLILLDIIVRAASDATRNSHLSDISDDTNIIQQRLTFGGFTAAESLTTIDSDTNNMRDSLNEIESATENIEAVAGYWTPMSLGQAITAGHLTIVPVAGQTPVVAVTHIVRYDENTPAGPAPAWRYDVVDPVRIQKSIFQQQNAGSTIAITGNTSAITTANWESYHNSSATGDAWAGNADNRVGELYDGDNMTVSVTGALGDAEFILHKCLVEVWKEAI